MKIVPLKMSESLATNPVSSFTLAMLLTMSDPVETHAFHLEMKLCQSAAASFTFRAVPVKLP